MSGKENRRKCLKCSRSPCTDDIKLFRFPKPGVRNLIRCELWAQYMFPEGEFSSITFQSKLHNEHRMLCQNHFLPGDFTDDSLKTLRRSAVPHDVEHQLPIYHVEPQAGSSRMVLQDVSSVHNVQPSSSATVLQDVISVHNVQPISSATSQSQAKQPQKTEKEKFLKNVIEKAKSIVNFDFLNGCTAHKEKNIDTITNSVFMICVKRFSI